MKKSKKILITHDGSFHTDDIFAAAVLSIYLEMKSETYEIIRTRDEKIINSGDYVFDVGGVYDEVKNRFDHHQIGGAGKHLNGIEFASFGLVWKKFGEEICGSQEGASVIEKKLVSPIDAWDNGFDLIENKNEVSPYYIQHAFLSMQPTWREENLTNEEMFLKSVDMAREFLSREIIQVKDWVLAKEIVTSTYERSLDKRIIILDKPYPYEYILNNFPEPLFVIYFKESNNSWRAKAVREHPQTFNNRKNFPKSWAGLRGEELQNVSGVSDAIFCHRALFMAVARSKEGAIKLAQIAVESN